MGFEIKSNNKVYGAIGESIAFKYLLKNRFIILEKNYKTFLGEIDIICKEKLDKDMFTYVFVEVKYRNSKLFGLPREAITKMKQNTIRKVATLYLKKHKLYDKVPVRFDCVEIIGEEKDKDFEINLIKNIF